jgi:hypothetical protein
MLLSPYGVRKAAMLVPSRRTPGRAHEVLDVAELEVEVDQHDVPWRLVRERHREVGGEHALAGAPLGRGDQDGPLITARTGCFGGLGLVLSAGDVHGPIEGVPEHGRPGGRVDQVAHAGSQGRREHARGLRGHEDGRRPGAGLVDAAGPGQLGLGVDVRPEGHERARSCDPEEDGEAVVVGREPLDLGVAGE